VGNLLFRLLAFHSQTISLELHAAYVKVNGTMLFRSMPSHPWTLPMSEKLNTLRRARKSLTPSLLALALLLCASAGLAQPPHQPPDPDTHPHDHGHHPPPHHPILSLLVPDGPPAKPSAVDTEAGPAVFNASRLGEPITLDHDWKVGITADDAPAQPSYDDSKWPIRDAKSTIAEINDSDDSDDKGPRPRDGDHKNGDFGPDHGHRFAWFRLHLLVPPHHGRLFLLLRVPVSRSTNVSFNGGLGLDLFANGKMIPPEGRNGPTPATYAQISRIYPLDIPEDQTSVVIAARTPYLPFGLDAYTAFFAHRTFYVGEGEDLHSHLSLWEHAMLFERLPTLVDCGIKVVLALFLFALFWTQRDHPEYLWLGLHFILVGPLAYVGVAVSMGQLDQLLAASLVFETLLISAYFYFEFLIAFLALRKRWYIYAMRYSAPLLLTLGPLLLLVRESKAIAVGLVISALFCVLWCLTWVVFVGLTLTISAIRRNYEAALLLLPLLLSIVGLVELVSTAGSSSWLGTPMQSPLTFEAGPIPIHFSDIADFVGILVIILIIFVRFLRIHRERERASSELAAARSVQELMIPRESPQTPGFHVDTVYTPAAEVGGDFFHIEATGDGGLLIVVGDVAGHGLQAAMNVSMLMGALRRSPEASPSQLLSALNQVLVGSASFTTCQVAYFSANGELVIASAGHPPPYLNSQEVLLPGGLPLGVVTGVDYEETRLYLHPGDRLLMMSDGVSEARRPNGELFGFDRVRNLSNQSAFFIADAAKEFGQEDDITVLTIRRLPQAAAVA